MDVEFYHMLFLHLLRWSCGFCLFFCGCGVSHWLICVCWTILVNLGLIQLGHGVWSFLCVVGFSLLMFCWEFLHLYSPKILACNFLFWWYLWFWYQGDGGFIECLWECSLIFNLLQDFEKDKYKFFFVCLVEFTCEAIRSWTFVCKEFFK